MKTKYFKNILSFVDEETGLKRKGYAYASFDKATYTQVWAFFKLANTGASTWACGEITEEEFEKGPIYHPDAVVFRFDEFFEKK